ncbi:exodeoxyribonuclease VII large subunit [Singulisphaera sp. PoT]|uniref:exodeoxyribonuclease VII large subunit n=1 Tax=Singulisphaera sp. PoT TaxID=3411797 RepID=UPI003BF5CD95
MTVNDRVDLNVPYVEKEDAKALGARWDQNRKVWFAPPGMDLTSFNRWLPQGFTPTMSGTGGIATVAVPDSDAEATAESGMALMDLLARVRGVVERQMAELVWVRAEISELRGKNGHYYLELAERNDRGDVLAQAQAVIWKSRAADIVAKFEAATGEGLRDNIKILCLVRVRFDVLYGFSLIIEDVDPSYTLGDLAAKLARIREKLHRDALYERNRGLAAPLEFVRIAVVSPSSSAGLGDFRRETDRLQLARLCDFRFYPATFQGLDAPSSIRTAINEALASHRRRPFDALVVIRGGGSVTDLAWLNDLELALLLCQAPIPVLTGIGHERDSTILDEIAHRRFDTPSKVALHIAATIKDNAFAALADLGRIQAQVEGILARERTSVQAQADRVKVGLSSSLERASSEQANQAAAIRAAAGYRVREASQAIENDREKVLGKSESMLGETELGLARMSEAVASRAQLQIGVQESWLRRVAQAVTLKAQGSMKTFADALDRLRSQSEVDATRAITKAQDDLNCERGALLEEAGNVLEQARQEVEAGTRMVVGLGPQATLRRGFAIARDGKGRPLATRKAAARLPTFEVEFQDGRLPVSNREDQGGDRDA